MQRLLKMSDGEFLRVFALIVLACAVGLTLLGMVMNRINRSECLDAGGSWIVGCQIDAALDDQTTSRSTETGQ